MPSTNQFQTHFFKQMNFTSSTMGERTLYADAATPNAGFILRYNRPGAYDFFVADYTIPKDFSLDFEIENSCLRLGLIKDGTSNFKVAEKPLTEFTPSAFAVIEDSISGVQTWHQGEHYHGTEILIDLAYLETHFSREYPEILPLLTLKRDFIYYYLPIEVINTLGHLRGLALDNRLSPLYLEASVKASLALISGEVSGKYTPNFENHYNYSTLQIHSRRTGRLTEQDIVALRKAHTIIDSRLDKPPTISELSSQVFISQEKLRAGFKKIYNTTVGHYIIDQRLQAAANLLSTTDLSIETIAGKVGYTNASNFAKAFCKKYSKTPLKFRKSNH